jgi:hypothetical protein
VTWTIHPRNGDLTRTADPIAHYTSLDLVERHNLPGTWVLEAPGDSLPMFTANTGCILFDGHNQVVSGRTRLVERVYEYNDEGVLIDKTTVGFIEDNKPLWGRHCYPDPTHAITSTPSEFDVSHDTRTGTREDLILAYIGAHLGPAAPITNRRLSGLVLPSSLGRGGTTTRKARMDVLGDLVAELAEGAGLRVRVVHDESTGTPRLLLTIDEVQDVSQNVVFGTPGVARATGFVGTYRYRLEAAEATDVIAFSAGEKEARQATRLSDEAAVSLWGYRSELLIDQRQTDDVDDITDALTERLAESASPTSVEFTVAEGPDTRYRTDYDVGSRVGVELAGRPAPVDNTVREAHTRIENGQPAEPRIVIGTPGSESRSTKEAARVNRLLLRMARLERSY